MKIGAHVSAAGGIDKAIGRASDIGAEAIQIFASSPRSWRFKPIDDAVVAKFRANMDSSEVDSVFLHGVYLVNLGGTPELVGRSVESLTNHMRVAEQIGAVGVIFHSGSHKGVGFESVFDQAVRALTEVLASGSTDASLIIENCAGMGDQIGASFVEIGKLIRAVDAPNLKVCIDTQHAFAAGYNIADLDGIDKAMEEFDSEIGLDRLVAVHANDTKIELGAGVDRHENIGEGFIGLDGFKTIMGHPAFRKVPFLLEVPGQDKKGPDRVNLDRLKNIRDGLSIHV